MLNEAQLLAGEFSYSPAFLFHHPNVLFAVPSWDRLGQYRGLRCTA